jgi:hypothetical protein
MLSDIKFGALVENRDVHLATTAVAADQLCRGEAWLGQHLKICSTVQLPLREFWEFCFLTAVSA